MLMQHDSPIPGSHDITLLPTAMKPQPAPGPPDGSSAASTDDDASFPVSGVVPPDLDDPHPAASATPAPAKSEAANRTLVFLIEPSKGRHSIVPICRSVVPIRARDASPLPHDQLRD